MAWRTNLIGKHTFCLRYGGPDLPLDVLDAGRAAVGDVGLVKDAGAAHLATRPMRWRAAPRSTMACMRRASRTPT